MATFPPLATCQCRCKDDTAKLCPMTRAEFFAIVQIPAHAVYLASVNCHESGGVISHCVECGKSIAKHLLGPQQPPVAPPPNLPQPQSSDSVPLRRVVCRFLGAHLSQTSPNSVSEFAPALTGRLLVLSGDISFTTFMQDHMPNSTGTKANKPDAQFWETVKKGVQQFECSCFDVEKDTSLTRCALFEDELGAQRSLKATLGDFVVLADTNYPEKLSDVHNQDEVLRRKLIAMIEVQSGRKNLEQAFTQLYLTLAVQHHSLRFLSPLLVGIVIGEKEHGEGWFLQPMVWRTDLECGAIVDGTFEATPENLIQCIKALLLYKSEKGEL